jgi:hypothetical protein
VPATQLFAKHLQTLHHLFGLQCAASCLGWPQGTYWVQLQQLAMIFLKSQAPLATHASLQELESLGACGPQLLCMRGAIAINAQKHLQTVITSCIDARNILEMYLYHQTWLWWCSCAGICFSAQVPTHYRACDGTMQMHSKHSPYM